MDFLNLKSADVLVVDDQPSNIQLMNLLLKDHYNIFMARSGEEALKIVENQVPDIILLDVTMPGMSGLEVCRLLKQNPLYENIPVIFITALGDTDDEIECWKAGCVDFVRKPINHYTLINRVKAHLTLKFQSDALRKVALTDGLTGVGNRRSFDIDAPEAFEMCVDNQVPCAIIMIDLDFFKGFNDYYGHLVGDDCLKLVAETVANQVPKGRGKLARYGGEEFVMMLTGLSEETIEGVIKSTLQSVEDLKIPHEQSLCSKFVTITAGCAMVKSNRIVPLEEVIRQADELLYRAKQAGRNRYISLSMGN
ncbi:diguanylate cyclase domain-containing protein [Marinomonas atlantica]|uniref:diguanylate cyclase domain-containing protein n=1 Tax=Marinomonas atlantica TaxID=1806668 RepID=UPI0008365CF9|nr:diguanylate cyclase [Marinomonas atlantica]